jgi:amino acid permease
MSDVEMAEMEDIHAEAPPAAQPAVGADGLPENPIPADAKDVESGQPAQPENGEENMEEKHPMDPEELDINNPNRVRRFATIMNLLNSLLGAGILSVPSSFTNVGLVPSIILLAFIAVLSYYATSMFMRLQLETFTAGLDELTLKVAGKVGQVILSILTLIFLESALMSYLILGGNMITSWLKLAKIEAFNIEDLWPRAIMILIYSIVLPIALSIPRSLKVLSYFSTATVFFIAFFVLAMVIKACDDWDGLSNKYPDKKVSYGKFDISVFSALSIYGLTFALPIVALPIVNHYHHSIHRRNIVALVSTILCFVLVVIPSIICYLMFGDKTKGDVLQNFDDDDYLILVVRIGFFLVVSFSYPCVVQPVAGSWAQVIYSDNDASKLPTGKRTVVQLVTHIIPLIIAMFLPQAKPVLAVGGAIGGCVVDFVYPPLLWYLHFKPAVKTWEFWLILLLGVFGLVTGIISTYQAILDVIKAFKDVGNGSSSS